MTEALSALLHTGRERLERAAIDDAPLEAEALLRHALGIGDDRAHLVARLRDPAPPETRGRFEALIARRLSREPLAYITGHREFYGLDMACSPAALIPRPETEMLVDLALDWLAAAEIERPLIIDAGTGSGALAVALATQLAEARVVATDVSRPALHVAHENATRHHVTERILLVQCHLLAAIGARADAIVANLPYVSEAEWGGLQPEIARFEPRGALVSGPRGTEVIERLLEEAPSRMAARSLLLCEHGATQGSALAEAARRAFPGARIETRRDLAGLDRVLRVERR